MIELELYVLQVLYQHLSDTNMTSYTGFLSHYLKYFVLVKSDIILFGLTGRICFGSLDTNELMSEMTGEDEDIQAKLIHVLESFWERIHITSAETVMREAKVRTRTLHYNFDLMPCQFLLSSSLNLPSFTVKESTPLLCQIEIRPIVWLPLVESIDIFLELDLDWSNWLLEGHRKMRLTMKVINFFFTIVLIISLFKVSGCRKFRCILQRDFPVGGESIMKNHIFCSKKSVAMYILE